MPTTGLRQEGDTRILSAASATVFWTAVAEWLPRLVGFGLMLYIGRQLGPVGFGVFSLAYAWVHLTWAGVDLGTGNYAVRILAERPQDRNTILAEILALNVTLAAVVFCLASVIVLGWVSPEPLRNTALVMMLFLPAFAVFPDWYLRGVRDLRLLGATNLAISICWLVLTFGFFRLTQPEGFALAWAVSPLAGALVFWTVLKRVPPVVNGFRMLSWLRHVKTSALFTISGVLSQAATPILLSSLQLISGSAAVGSYALGLRVGTTIAGGFWLVLLNLTPLLVIEKDRVKPERIVLASIALAAALFACQAVLFPTVLPSLIGHGYIKGLGLLMLGAAVLVPWGGKFAVEALLISRGQDRDRIAVGCISLGSIAVSAVVGLAMRNQTVLLVGFLVGEAAAGSGGWLLLRRHARRVSTRAAQPRVEEV